MIISNIKDFPVIPVRSGMTCEEVELTALQNTGVGLISYGCKVGDVIEFPDNKESVRIMSRQVRKGSDAREMLIAVYKNGNPSWFSVANLRRWDIDMKPVHQVSEDLRNCENDMIRIEACLGKKITAKDEVTFKEAVFENGVRVEGDSKSRTVSNLIWVNA
jgi:hypothetical protein